MSSYVLHWISKLLLDMTRRLMWVTSMCTALVVRQLKRKQHLFNESLRNLKLKGEKQSNPAWVSANIHSSCRSCGKSAIVGWFGLAFLSRHLRDLVLSFLKTFATELSRIIAGEYFSRTLCLRAIFQNASINF